MRNELLKKGVNTGKMEDATDECGRPCGQAAANGLSSLTSPGSAQFFAVGSLSPAHHG
jgi:hypothetical protein